MMENSKILPEKLAKKLTGGKKPGKDQWLIIILTGVLLCVIALPVQKKDSKSDISDMIDDTIDNHISPDAGEAYPGDCGSAGTASSYTGYWENRLEDALGEVDGVGRVKVLINVRQSEQKIVEKDGPEEHSETAETDSAGGSRTVGETRVEKSTIYTEDNKGRSVPYVVTTIAPAVEGVLVVAQGAGRQDVRENIIGAIQVLFNIDANKIKIVKMINNQ